MRAASFNGFASVVSIYFNTCAMIVYMRFGLRGDARRGKKRPWAFATPTEAPLACRPSPTTDGSLRQRERPLTPVGPRWERVTWHAYDGEEEGSGQGRVRCRRARAPRSAF